jgi:heme/copper-type cytochrome/quinol oxidase subunit 4
MATVSRWRSSRPLRPRLQFVGLEVFLLALLVFVAGVSELPVYLWFALAFVSIVVQTVLFYYLGRAREKLER